MRIGSLSRASDLQFLVWSEALSFRGKRLVDGKGFRKKPVDLRLTGRYRPSWIEHYVRSRKVP